MISAFKKLTLMVMFLAIFMFPLQVNAQTAMGTNPYGTKEFIESGYTSDGIYYEIYDIDKGNVSCYAYKYVTREIIFSGRVNPPATLSQSVEEQGIVYAGTLRLIRFVYSNNQTIAYYQGYLYPQNE